MGLSIQTAQVERSGSTVLIPTALIPTALIQSLLTTLLTTTAWAGMILELGLLGVVVQAQTQPDQSLGNESSVVMPQDNQDLVSGGARRGDRLFHSFEGLNVGEGRSLYFANPGGIDQIFSRVTGSAPSQIDGTLGVLGNADLFLLNPNGVLFGPNARLDLNGSFTATTAASLQLGEFTFSSTAPTASPLLNLAISPGLQPGQSALGSIQPDSLIRNQGQLRVGTGQSLSLIAGSIDQTGQILAPAGRVELRGDRLSLSGNIDTRDGSGSVGTLRLSSPGDLAIRADAAVTNSALTNNTLTHDAINQALLTNGVWVESDRDLTLTGPLRSTSSNPLTLQAGRDLALLSGQGNNAGDSALAGDVTLSSDRNLRIENALSVINLQPQNLTLRSGGDVIIQPDRLTQDRTNLFISSRETGPGRLSVQAQNLRLTNGEFATIANGPGNGANLDIQVAQDIVLRQNSSIVTSSNAQGNSGNLAFQAGNDITLQAARIGSFSANGSGDAGDILLSAQRLSLDDQAIDPRQDLNSPAALIKSQIFTTTDLFSSGNSGRITIRASDRVTLQGNQPGPGSLIGLQPEAVIREVENGTLIVSTAFGRGQSGNIAIETPRLTLRDGVGIGIAPGLFAQILGMFGEDQESLAGNVDITANAIELQGLASIASLTLGSKDAGNITIRGDRLSLTDGAAILVNSLTLEPTFFPDGGDAGRLRIDVRDLTVLNGSFLGAGTDTAGSGGELMVNADHVTIAGVSADGSFPSSLRTDVGTGVAQLEGRPNATGKGGQITINANQLRVLDGGQIVASTTSVGDAGNINIRAQTVEVSGSSRPGPSGIPSGIPSTLAAESRGTGAAGMLQVEADRLTIRDRAAALTESQLGDGGDILLNLRDFLLLRQQGRISATAGSAGTLGDGGNIRIDAGVVVAPPNENSDITANAFEGSGGNVTVTTQGLFGIAPRTSPTAGSDITASSALGISGRVDVLLLGLDPNQGLVELPLALLNPDDDISTDCQRNARSSFVATGRGGLPVNPTQQLSRPSALQDWRDSSGSLQSNRPLTPASAAPAMAPAAAVLPSTPVEAQAWQQDKQGQVQLITASPSQPLPHASLACADLPQPQTLENQG